MIQNVVQQNKATCSDSIIGFGATVDYTYFTALPGVTSPLSDGVDEVLQIIYMGSLNTIQSHRNVYTLLNCLGDIGGL
jgi:hypothetical protein